MNPLTQDPEQKVSRFSPRARALMCVVASLALGACTTPKKPKETLYPDTSLPAPLVVKTEVPVQDPDTPRVLAENADQDLAQKVEEKIESTGEEYFNLTKVEQLFAEAYKGKHGKQGENVKARLIKPTTTNEGVAYLMVTFTHDNEKKMVYICTQKPAITLHAGPDGTGTSVTLPAMSFAHYYIDTTRKENSYSLSFLLRTRANALMKELKEKKKTEAEIQEAFRKFATGSGVNLRSYGYVYVRAIIENDRVILEFSDIINRRLERFGLNF